MTDPMREVMKYKFRCINQRDRLQELFDLLELDRMAQAYRVEQSRKHNSNEFRNLAWDQIHNRCVGDWKAAAGKITESQRGRR